MIRLVVTIADASMAANVGGPTHITYKTIDADLPELEAILKTHNPKNYREVQVSGVELVDGVLGEIEGRLEGKNAGIK